MPDVSMVCVCWLVSWYPRLPNFTMPKAASLMIAPLALLRARQLTDSLLPAGRSATCWLEAYEDCCLNATVAALVLNVFGEIIFASWEDPDLAQRLSHILKGAYPAMFSVCMLISWFFIGGSAHQIRIMQTLNMIVAITYVVV